MQKIKFLLVSIALLAMSQSAFSQKTTEVKGYAPGYVGQKIELYEIEDYFSMREALIATTMVEADSTFKFSFFNEKTQKVILKSNKNKGFLYIQPNAKYEVFMPSKNKYDAYRPDGNSVEISFLELDSTDINYKILSFDKWTNNFLGTYFYTKQINGLEFVMKLDTFKMNVENAYKLDTSLFFKTYVKYTIAGLDDIQFKGTRNRYEKFDFFLNNAPVVYESDVYMDYLASFYENIFSRLEMEVNNRVYLGLLKNSPSLIMRALGDEYTLRPTIIKNPTPGMKPGNTKLRELIMIKGLSEVFYSGEFPQTNILSVLDSVAKFSIFKTNGIIAKNMIYRLTELVPGSKAPDFVIKNQKGENVSLRNYTKKHLYIHFFDPSTRESAKDLELLNPIYAKFQGDVNFISIYVKNDKLTKKQIETLKSLPWETFELEADDPIFKAYHIESLPLYVLLDAYGYIVNVPALGPKPNGQYLSIDKIFFDIKKINESNK